MPIERLSEDLDRLLSADQDIQELADGFGGDNGPAEGPLWWSDGGYLLFSDIHNNRRMKWSQDEGVSLFQQPTNHANGLTRDLKGRLLACEHSARRVTRQDADGEITVIANRYRGNRLNRPNDVIVKSDGNIYFTDPGAPAPGLDLDYSGVYMVSPDLDEITLLVGDFVTPNGIAFSPRRKRPLRKRHPTPAHTRVRPPAQRNPRPRLRPRPVRPLRRPPRRPGRHEGGRRRQHLLRRLRRSLGHRLPRQPPRNRRPRPRRHHQRSLRRPRLEDPILHHLEHRRQRPAKHPRHPRPYQRRLKLT